MNCEALNTYLDLLMDSELTDEQQREMEAHARQCPQCAESIRRTRQLKALLEQMEPEVDVPLPAQAKWRGAVREAAKRNRMRRLYRWIGSAAAAVAVLVGVSLALNQRGLPQNAVRTAPAVLESAPEAEAVEEADYAEDADYAEEADFAEDAANAYEAESADAAYEAAIPLRMQSKAAGAVEAPTENAVIEADGAVADEDDFADFVDGADAGMCAAVALKTSAYEATLRVKDVDAACRQIEDLAREYEGEADVQRLEDGGASICLTLDAANAADLIEAIAPLNVGDEALELSVQDDDQVLQILLTVVGE